VETFNSDQTQSEFSGEIAIASSTFNCFNKMMTKDFQETVQAEDHPEIHVRFFNLIRNSAEIHTENLNGMVEITLAGKAHCYPISCKLETLKSGKLILTGKQSVNFSDFLIDPPSKFLGTVKVHNAITVQFELHLEES